MIKQAIKKIKDDWHDIKEMLREDWDYATSRMVVAQECALGKHFGGKAYIGYIARKVRSEDQWRIEARLTHVSRGGGGAVMLSLHELKRVDTEDEAMDWLMDHEDEIEKHAVSYLRAMGHMSPQEDFPAFFKNDI